MNYAWHLVSMISVYSILSLALNVLLGYGGMLALSMAAIYGVGAYVFAIGATAFGIEFLPALLASVVLSMLSGWALTRPVLRLRGDFFVLATLGGQTLLLSVFQNAVALTGGTQGIAGIPVPRIFGFSLDSPARFALLAALLALAAIGLSSNLSRSPYGLLLECSREDPSALESLGCDVTTLRESAVLFSSALAGVAGALQAAYSRFVDPTSFGVLESVFILSCVVLGGAASRLGPVLGATLLILLPEALRLLRIQDAQTAHFRQLAFGLLLILCMRFRPQGLVGRYRFD